MTAFYENIKVLGSGAHAVVYLARDTTTGDLYAVKEFLGGGRAAHFFFRELSSLTALQHSNIVRCFDVIYGQEGARNKLVLEYAAGGSLRDVLNRRGALPMREAAEVMRDVAAGLAYAHDRQVLHRDLKPENILVFPDAAGRTTYKIADLGIANHLANVFDRQKPNGSPAYMAPEQFYDFATYASDLYSLGVIFYELLTGDRPFQGLPEELFVKHAKQPPDLNPIPEAVRPIVAKLLQKSPAERPRSAQALHYLLEAQLASLSAPAGVSVFAVGYSGDAPLPADDTTQAPAPPAQEHVSEHISVLEPLFSYELAGSQQLFTLNPSRRAVVYIVDDRTTGFLELDRRRFVPYFLPERITAAAAPTLQARTSYFATNRHLYALTATEHAPRRLFQLLFPVTSLAVTPSETLLILANKALVAGYSLEGRRQWEIELYNYLQSPQLVVLSEDDVLVSSGPIHPAVTWLDARGRIKYRIALPAPALTLLRASGEGDFQVALFGDGGQQPMRLLTFRGDREVAAQDLGEAAYAAKNHGDFVTFFHPSGRISLASNGLVIAEYQPVGMILDDAWAPVARAYVHLERRPPHTFVNVFRLTTFRPATYTPPETT
ncbi:MAG: serine/threonine protein kinase [Chloracidobacterium sp.]|nr:serine/threonine protein kinase [Chloracidobacterium sp.]MDW8217364.1 serine/threonine-protein kinase [Acidobacteriota bacterium]